MTTVTVANPWTNALVERDISGMTQGQLDAYLQLIDDETLYALEGVGETPAEWFYAYVAKVGPEEAGRVLLGS